MTWGPAAIDSSGSVTTVVVPVSTIVNDAVECAPAT